MEDRKEYYFLFGLKPFETLYFENKKVHFVYEHYRRMKRAFHILSIPFELSYEDFEKALSQFVQNITSDFGAIRIFLKDQYLYIEEREVKYNRELFKRGLRVSISKSIKFSRNILNFIKTFNMGLNVIEEERAKKKGFDTALFLNERGLVTETSFGNIFFRKGRIIYTPHILSGVLPGIMRKEVIKISGKLGYEIKKIFLSLEDIKKMEECFLTNSIAGVFPVRNLGDICFSSRDFCEEVSSIEFLRRPWNK
ncbi:MAG: aminotransferase class IV [Dictyoglomus sp.]|nr:aminotransferase class IV [Dictyoglomus sp.]MCX7942636.1 aminotransferase class IV [Dictyoglomaceae bacterium]MDW8188901.1 aminotransferase class IV [Dictyoglomus sp.]